MPKIYWWERVKDILKPRLCTHLCQHDLHRFHFSCLTCRERRWAQGKFDKRYYVLAHGGHVVVPLEGTTYTLLIDTQRKFSRLKNKLMSPFLSLCEFLAN